MFKRIEELKLMRIKCVIYPFITVIIWIVAITYRIIDKIIVGQFDEGGEPSLLNIKEKIFFEKYPFFNILLKLYWFFIHYFLH